MRRANREREFSEYFEARGQALRRLAYGLCGNWHVAEDLVQSTFVRLYRGWARVRRDSVDAYSRRILVNAFLSGRRRYRRESVVSVVPDHPTCVDTDVADRLTLHQVLDTLAPRQRAVVVLRYLEDLSVAEVADLLGVTEGTVKSQAARGLAALRVRLSGPIGSKAHNTAFHATPSKE